MEGNKSGTTVRINNEEPPCRDLESNVTVVTTTHPPALHIHPVPLETSTPTKNNQVVIVANETNKTQVIV